ncbi:HAMP domain-containing sensor histidine kinase [Thermus sp.]|uniref:sensor histidine kinase n=1 Tax=Thermus sp. TaxID=275 RepID=UPI00321F836B
MRLLPRLALAMALVAVSVAGLSGWLAYRVAADHVGRALSLGGSLGNPGAPRMGLRRQRFLQDLRASLWTAVGGALLLGLGVGTLLASNLVRPVQELAEVAEAYRKGDRRRRARVVGKDEVAEVARSFNLLLDTLERKEAEEKRLFSDIAHDLRTPLTVLQGDLEAMEDGLLPCTPENLRRLQEEVRFLARLVEDIRLLTQAEEGALRLSPKVLDLEALARKMLDRFRIQAEAKGVQLSLAGEPLWVLADAEALSRVLQNLLDNAMRHTPPGGRVEVALGREGSWARLEVRDTGPGLRPGEEEKVFQRFYRGDPARTRGGSGLGLSIAKALAEAMGGRLQGANRKEGGAVFALWLPLTQGKGLSS